MSDIYETTTQLTALWPALAAALARDTTTNDGPATTGWTSAVPYNPDVLTAACTLAEEVPAAHHAACDLTGERWQPRPPGTCLRALPRLASRMDTTGHHREATILARQASGWLRLTKRALGLRKPDILLAGYACPYTADQPENHQDSALLFMAGAEGRLRDTPDGLTVEWVVADRIYCSSPDCGASWTALWEWHRLGLMLGVPSLAATA